MTRNENETAVSEVIGVVLMLGLAVLLIAILQVSAVPIWNEEVEIDHNRGVQDEMVEVREGVLSTAGAGGARSVSVELGTDYPNRIVLRNPAASSGRLRTVGEGQVRLNNLSFGDGNADDYWSNVTPNLPTRALIYSPDYNEYQNAPDTGYDNTVVFNQGNGEATLTDQTVVNGDVITLPVLNGSFSEIGTGRTTVDLSPRSVSTDGVTVSPDGAGPHFETPTQLSEDTWDSLLNDQTGINHEVSGGMLRITLTGGEYRLRMAEVSVDSSGPDDSPAYLTYVESLSQGDAIVVEARDKYNNPVQSATVGVSDGDCEETTRETGMDGRAAFDCDGSEDTVLYVNDDDGTSYEEVEVGADSTETAADDPTASASLERREDDFGQAYGGFLAPPDDPVDVSQYVLNYTASSDVSANVNIESVFITLREGDGDVISSTTHSPAGRSIHSDRWVSSWIREDDIDSPGDVEASIELTDEAGNTYTCVVSLTGGCDDTVVSGITLTLGSTTVETGETTTATVTTNDGTDVTSPSTITSANSGIASVSGNTVTGESSGTTTITAEYNGLTASQTLSVQEAQATEFTSLTAEVDIQQQQDRLRSAEFSYSLESSNTVTFSVQGFGSETNTGTSGTVQVNPGGQQDLPVTLRGEIQGGECLEIQIPSGTNDGTTFNLVSDGSGC